jgi:soluble lytic murein transglycosylase
MRTGIGICCAFLLFIAAFFYFDLPRGVIKPVFHADTIRLYADKYGFDPLFITALIHVESGFARTARSADGATGLMQLMPSTARELATELSFPSFSERDLEEPEINIHLGTYYLYTLRRELNGNDLLVLAAYNAGLGKVQFWRSINPLFGTKASDIPYPETRNYVRKVTRTYAWLKRIQSIKNLLHQKKA